MKLSAFPKKYEIVSPTQKSKTVQRHKSKVCFSSKKNANFLHVGVIYVQVSMQPGIRCLFVPLLILKISLGRCHRSD